MHFTYNTLFTTITLLTRGNSFASKGFNGGKGLREGKGALLLINEGVIKVNNAMVNSKEALLKS